MNTQNPESGAHRGQHTYEFTDHGLAYCLVCGGAEGSLPSCCPKQRMPTWLEHCVYAGIVDYALDGWIWTAPPVGFNHEPEHDWHNLGVISSFSGNYRFLSNFYDSPMVIDGAHYQTAEHAFQAYKSPDPAYHEVVRLAKTPSLAKRLGRAGPVHVNWERVKIDVMRTILEYKFYPETPLAQQLVSTFPAFLIEGNNWGDDFWGVATMHGRNELGILLMRQRNFLIRHAQGSSKRTE